MDKILALNGVHTAGKSSLGELLKEREELNYFPEIAQKLIDEEGSDWGEAGSHEFQQSIYEQETERDRMLIREDLDHAIVETWHTGCLAHSMENASESLVEEQDEYMEVFNEHTDVEIYAVFLNMPLENIWDRSPHFEEGDETILEFYDEVRDNHFQIYDTHSINHIVVENEGDIEKSYETVKEFAYEVLEQ